MVALSGGAHWQEYSDIVAASGLVNTQLGPGEFLENFAMWSEPIKATRTVREPYPDVVEAPISMDDIARVAAALLVENEQSHYGQMYELTGPEALTRAQIAEQIGVGIGAAVTFEQCSRAEAEAALRPAMGARATWYLDLMADAVQVPQAGQSTGGRADRHAGAVGGAVGRGECGSVSLNWAGEAGWDWTLKYVASGGFCVIASSRSSSSPLRSTSTMHRERRSNRGCFAVSRVPLRGIPSTTRPSGPRTTASVPAAGRTLAAQVVDATLRHSSSGNRCYIGS